MAFAHVVVQHSRVMTREEFKGYIDGTIESFIQEAEHRAGRALPRRYCFGFCNPVRVTADQENVAEHLAQLCLLMRSTFIPVST